MPVEKIELWESWVKANNDPYGKACVDVARSAMEILDEEPGAFKPHDVICRADIRSKAGGITGFMTGAVAIMVSKCHSRGEEFRKAWNGDIGKNTGQENSDGVLNPALLTISV